MTIIQDNPKTPTQRFLALRKRNLWRGTPESSLVVRKHRCKGRNCFERTTSRRRGGGHKRLIRVVDFFREKFDIRATVKRIEYDPNHTADIALLKYADGEKRYILALRGSNIGDQVVSLNVMPRDFSVGMSLRLALIPTGVFVHCTEIEQGREQRLLLATECVHTLSHSGDVAIKMPRVEVRLLDEKCRATIGHLGNNDHGKQPLGKVGCNRWLGRRSRVRRVVMNPVDHPMGRGEGRTSGGGHPAAPCEKFAKGFPTRKRSQSRIE
jgi:large subunit ribosomal protein L2